MLVAVALRLAAVALGVAGTGGLRWPLHVKLGSHHSVIELFCESHFAFWKKVSAAGMPHSVGGRGSSCELGLLEPGDAGPWPHVLAAWNIAQLARRMSTRLTSRANCDYRSC